MFGQGSNERDRSSPTTRSSSFIPRSSPVILSAAKDLAAHRDRPFAEFTLSEAHVLRVTRGDCSNGQVLFFTWYLAFGCKCIKQPAVRVVLGFTLHHAIHSP